MILFVICVRLRIGTIIVSSVIFVYKGPWIVTVYRPKVVF